MQMTTLALVCGALLAATGSSLSSPPRARIYRRHGAFAEPGEGEVREVECTKMNKSKIPSIDELDEMLRGGGDAVDDGKKRNPNIPSLEMIETMLDESINEDDPFGGIPRAAGD